MPMYFIVCESVVSYALDRSLRAGYAAAGSAVRQLDVRRSSVSLVPGCGGECILANNQKQ